MFTRVPLVCSTVLATGIYHFPSEPGHKGYGVWASQSEMVLSPPLTDGTNLNKSYNLSEPPFSYQ